MLKGLSLWVSSATSSLSEGCTSDVVVSTHGMEKIGSRTNELDKQLSSNKPRR